MLSNDFQCISGVRQAKKLSPLRFHGFIYFSNDSNTFIEPDLKGLSLLKAFLPVQTINMMKTSINSFKVAHFVISGWYCAVLLAETQLAQFSLYVHKGGLKPDSFHFFFYLQRHQMSQLHVHKCIRFMENNCDTWG